MVNTQLIRIGLGLVLVATGSLSLSADKTQPTTNSGGKSVQTNNSYLLRYRFSPEESIRYQVTHVAKTKTRIRGAEEISHVHTVSEKLWEVKDVTAEGAMTFVHSVQSVEMMQQAGDADEIRWDSRSDQSPPLIFETVAEQLKTPLSTVTINPRGQETTRQKHAGTDANLGMGGLTLPLPEEPITVGHAWSVPREIKARGESGEVKVVKARDTYTLEKVQTGVATLQIRSEILTPVDEPSIKAQIVQQLSNGSIRFDIDSGRVLSKQLDWDETVVGFQGHNSLMEYRARVTEQLIEGPVRTAKKRLGADQDIK